MKEKKNKTLPDILKSYPLITSPISVEGRKVSFFCPFCGRKMPHICEVLRLYKKKEASIFGEDSEDIAFPELKPASNIVRAVCLECDNYSLGIQISRLIDPEGRLYSEIENREYLLYIVYPFSITQDIPDPNEDMPDDLQALYREASSIFCQSPRAASILLRLCLQKLLRSLGFKGSIKEMLTKLENSSIEKEVLSIMDSCRIIGNFSAHETDNLNTFHAEKMKFLFDAINLITQSTYSYKRQQKEIASNLEMLSRKCPLDEKEKRGIK